MHVALLVYIEKVYVSKSGASEIFCNNCIQNTHPCGIGADKADGLI